MVPADFAQSPPAAIARRKTLKTAPKAGATPRRSHAGFPASDTIVEADGHIGHGAVLHGCVVRHGALVGMNAVVMDEAEIGEHAFVAACAFVRAGMHVPPRSLVAGVPAKVLRELSEAEIAWKHAGTLSCQES